MTSRPIFKAINSAPFFKAESVNFTYYSGFSLSQKQKSINSLHSEYTKTYPKSKILEISSKSSSELGISLSAFNLNIITTKRSFSVECAFQSSKVFEHGGPYTDLLTKSSRDAKKDDRLRNSGKLKSFKYFDSTFPIEPADFFYNWLYINALYLHPELSNEITKYDCFSDIEFNPQKSINCQAKAAAIFVGLSRAGELVHSLDSRESFLKIIYGVSYIPVYEQLSLNIEN